MISLFLLLAHAESTTEESPGQLRPASKTPPRGEMLVSIFSSQDLLFEHNTKDIFDVTSLTLPGDPRKAVRGIAKILGC